MSVRIYNLLWNLKRFWRKNITRVYVDLGAECPLFFLNLEGRFL